jgi:type I restriction enzyme, S subunit
VDSIESKVAAAREKTEKLRQSILAKAFSGELVETEAEIARREGREYETAEVLLERIKKEKGKNGKKAIDLTQF